jgi:glycosyltransferase involved in cell wall biosynthesis
VTIASQGPANSTLVTGLSGSLIHDDSPPSIVICIPAFNEETMIGGIVSRSKTYGTQVVVCDDGSADDTASEASKNGATVTTHLRNLGKGAALKTLLQEASKFHPDIIVTLDGDGQHDPSDIPLLTRPVLDGLADVVVGCRFNGKNQIPFYRRFGNYLLNLITNWSAGTSIRDTQSGFRAYSSRVIPAISIGENGMGVDSEILIELARMGFKIEERDITVTYGGDTSTLNPVSHIIRVVWSIVLPKHSQRRIVSRVSWTLALGSLTTALVLLRLVRIPFSWLGFGVSTLAFTIGISAIALSPDGKFIRWLRRDKAARFLHRES